MNEETKTIIREMGIFVIASIIGGFIGGMAMGLICKCCSCHCCEHHKYGMHHKGMNKMPHKFNKHHGMPEFEGEFFEEEYIIIPKKSLEKPDRPNPPIAPHRR